jgi:serine/threonine-protein kinase
MLDRSGAGYMASAPQADAKGLSDLTEAELVRTVLERNLATQAEIDQCRAHQERLSRKDENKPLLQIMVEARVLTPTQAKRLLQEAGEAGKFREPPGYQIISPIGQGSMGMVYRAKQLSMDRTVALKILLRQLAMNKDFIERFHREARIAAKLSHNNVVQAIDSGEYAGHHYFVMEYVDGTNIKQELDKGKVYGEREALQIILQIAEALGHAHQKGLIHRDIKPENIMMTKDGTAKLADLGLARLTADETLAQAEKGVAIGTPYYISPEQIRGAVDVDIRSDIYSLGATLYHMVTGRVPFPGKTPTEVMQKHMRAKLVPPDHINTNLTSGTGELVETTMARDRERRYASPEDLIIDLKSLLAGQPPLLARQTIGHSTMASLAEGDEAEDTAAEIGRYEEAIEELAAKVNRYRASAVLLGILLGGAALIILVLLLRDAL